jgi:hypothetical protein
VSATSALEVEATVEAAGDDDEPLEALGDDPQG